MRPRPDRDPSAGGRIPGRRIRAEDLASSVLLALALAAGGCLAPIRADRVTTRQAYAQVEANALRTGKSSAETTSILHRLDLADLAEDHPDLAVQRLHPRAAATGERNLLFALAELSFTAAEHIRRSPKARDPRDARDYYLGSAVYAWLFLFGEANTPAPGAFDRRFRDACDFYNQGLGLAFGDRRSTNAVVRLDSGPRRLPVGSVEVTVDGSRLAAPLDSYDHIVLADRFRVRGLSVRTRNAGIGAPLILAGRYDPEFRLRPSTPATALLRGPMSLLELASGPCACALELHSTLDGSVEVYGASVPLETDLTAHRAYTLSQSRAWKLGRLDFLAPAEHVSNQLILHQPYEADRIPVVFVHGTFSSPVTWAEMANTLTADPTLRRRYQLWSYIYGSGNPLLYSVADLRKHLSALVQREDPQGSNTWLRQMVIIGHSQGGLLAKGTAVDTGEQLWNLVSSRPLEDLDLSEGKRDEFRSLLVYQPLPFVKRIVFIATPHRGSYLSGNLARRLARRLVTLPRSVLSRSAELMNLSEGTEAARFLRDRLPTSLDGMSPKNPGLRVMANLPIDPGIKAHSIIPVRGRQDSPEKGRDGVVAYQSAHLEGVESEFLVDSGHSCLNAPATIEEVRRILHEHLRP